MLWKTLISTVKERHGENRISAAGKFYIIEGKLTCVPVSHVLTLMVQNTYTEDKILARFPLFTGYGYLPSI
jgi:hypothetical protein